MERVRADAILTTRGGGQSFGLVLCRNSKAHPVFDGAEGPREILIRFSLYQRM